MIKRKMQYYRDGITKITDPFYVCECPGGHQYWSTVYVTRCAMCGERLVRCAPPESKKKNGQ